MSERLLRTWSKASHLVRAHFVLTVVPLCVPLFTVVLVHGWYIFRAAGWSGCGAFAEVHWDAAGVVVEHCDEFEACAERFQVLAQR